MSNEGNAKHTCGDCKHGFQTAGGQGQPLVECRRYPPQMALITMPNPLAPTQPSQVMKQSGYPNCFDICGEFVERPNVVKLGV